MWREFRRKSSRLGCIFLGVAASFCIVVGSVSAQSTKKVGQHKFQLPEDWPVEKRGSLIIPVSTEEYVSQKFKAMENELGSLRAELEEKIKSLGLSVEKTENALKAETKKNRSESEKQEDLAKSLSNALADIGYLKREIDLIGRRMTGKIDVIEKELEKINPDIEFIKDNLNGLQTQIYRLDEKVDYFHEE